MGVLASESMQARQPGCHSTDITNALDDTGTDCARSTTLKLNGVAGGEQ